MFRRTIFLLLLPLAGLGISAPMKDVRPGFGYAGRLEPYPASTELRLRMAKFGMTAGWFRRDELPEDYMRFSRPQVNELPYLLFSPKRSATPVPMVVYFGGTGEQGTNLVVQFNQTTLFSRLTAPDFQKRHPCYIFAPLMPKGSVMRAALPGSSKLADLTCDAMYTVIASLKSPKVDTNRLYVTGLSWGGVAAFELSCGFPGRFAACVPTSCIQSPARIPKSSPGNYWMLYNENSYQGEGSRRALRKIEEIVRNGGGDFRRSTFPDRGHNAWSKAWCEESVWEWVFAKGASRANAHDNRVRIIAQAKCTASVPGMDDGRGPERIIDGLDATAYVSARPARRGDRVEIVFPEPVRGKFRLVSGLKNGSQRLGNAVVEASSGGEKWSRVGMFTERCDEVRFELRRAADRLRIVFVGDRPTVMVIRKIVPEDG